MAIQAPDIWLTYEEMEILLDSIHAYASTSAGKRCSSGQCDFLQAKLSQAKLNGSALRVYR